jgi:hypothetical protein
MSFLLIEPVLAKEMCPAPGQNGNAGELKSFPVGNSQRLYVGIGG